MLAGILWIVEDLRTLAMTFVEAITTMLSYMANTELAKQELVG